MGRDDFPDDYRRQCKEKAKAAVDFVAKYGPLLKGMSPEKLQVALDEAAKWQLYDADIGNMAPEQLRKAKADAAKLDGEQRKNAGLTTDLERRVTELAAANTNLDAERKAHGELKGQYQTVESRAAEAEKQNTALSGQITALNTKVSGLTTDLENERKYSAQVEGWYRELASIVNPKKP